jgi:hypothetical protein
MDINNYNNYIPNTQPINMGKNMYNYNSAYQQNTPLIEHQQFQNNRLLLHDNCNSDLLAQNIMEYYINIDSNDRKMDTYPNPYNYVVSFKPLGKSRDSRYKTKKGGVIVHETIEYDETPGPVIIRNFKNVKYVKLDRVILSRHHIVKFVINQTIHVDNNNNIIETDIDRKVSRKKISKKDQDYDHDSELCDVCCCDDCCCVLCNSTKYVLLKVKELETYHTYATNTLSSDNSFVLYVDKTLGTNNNMWFPTYGSCVYPTSLLSNIDRFTIEFFDMHGHNITPKVIIEYNIDVVYLNDVTKIQYCLLFGNYEDNLVKKIKKRYDNNYMIFKFNDLCKIKPWVDKIFSEISKKINQKYQNFENIFNKTDKNNKLIYHEKIIESIKNLNICDKIKHISNNVFFIIGIFQNELNTNIKYEK